MGIKYPSIKGILKRVLIFILCFGIGWYMKGRLSPSAGMGGFMQGEVYVLAKKSQNKEVTSAYDKITYVEAIKDVNLLPKVTGTVEKVLFKEGSLVHEGDVLFEIDPSKYQAAYDLAKAQVDSAKANLVKAERDYNRQVQLSKEKFASKATFDTSESAYLQAQAAVEVAQANLDVAKLDLEYTKVRSPITGRIGKALVTTGNYVVASSQVLAKIVQINPMRITFSLSDKEAISLRSSKYDLDKVTAQITLPTGNVINTKVVNAFFDNAVNSSTATVSVYADVENNDGLLIPGNYVQSAILTGDQTFSIVVPQSALNHDKDGAFVYVVKIDKEKSTDTEIHGIADQRRVVLGDAIGDSDQAIISGLKADELVVTQGTVKIQNGSAIKVGVIE